MMLMGLMPICKPVLWSGNAHNIIVANLSSTLLVISSKMTMCNFVTVSVVTTILDYS